MRHNKETVQKIAGVIAERLAFTERQYAEVWRILRDPNLVTHATQFHTDAIELSTGHSNILSKTRTQKLKPSTRVLLRITQELTVLAAKPAQDHADMAKFVHKCMECSRHTLQLLDAIQEGYAGTATTGCGTPIAHTKHLAHVLVVFLKDCIDLASAIGGGDTEAMVQPLQNIHLHTEILAEIRNEMENTQNDGNYACSWKLPRMLSALPPFNALCEWFNVTHGQWRASGHSWNTLRPLSGTGAHTYKNQTGGPNRPAPLRLH